MIANSASEADIDFKSLDGINLRGTIVVPPEPCPNAVVLVHGGGVTRHEGGFYARLASGLAEAGMASLRFDLRGHGESGGRQEDLTISGVANDIRSAADYLHTQVGNTASSLVGASFGGGISAFYASRNPERLQHLVLFNPLLNYKKRFIDDKPYWHDERISAEMAEELNVNGFINHSPTFRLGRPLLNEVFYIQPHLELGRVTMPVLIVHGTADTFVPIESSRAAVAEVSDRATLIEVDGAQHGIAVHDDPLYQDPQTQGWQSSVIRVVTDWLS